jgi:hypothetical protein
MRTTKTSVQIPAEKDPQSIVLDVETGHPEKAAEQILDAVQLGI